MNKKLMIRVMLLLLLSCKLSFPTKAQSYQVGDTITSFTTRDLINWNDNSFSIEKLKGKALIIDFWATWCSPCVALFPKMDSLKKKFAGDLIIIGATREKNDVVKKFAEKYKQNFGINISSITDAQDLSRMFPHFEVPHYVWINKNGIVQAITKPHVVTEENIRKLIHGEALNLPVKNDGTDIATRKVFHNLVDIDKSRGFPSLITYSYLGGYQENINSHSTAPIFDKTSNTTRIKAINVSMSTLYKIAYFSLSGASSFHNKRVIYESIKEPVPNYISNHNLFSYDQIIRGDSEQETLDRMKRILDAQFGVSSRLETRKMECFILTLAPSFIKSSNDSSQAESYQTADSIFSENVPFNLLLNQWNGNIPLLPYPIVDETGLESGSRINISLPKKGVDITQIINAFAKAGLILKKEYREMNVIVLNHN